jgi:hypothetical protein
MSLAKANHQTQSYNFIDGLIFTITQYYIFHNGTFSRKITLCEKRVEITYLLLSWSALVRSKVQFQLYHLTYHMIIISILVSSNHINIIIHIPRIHMFTFKCSTHYTIIQWTSSHQNISLCFKCGHLRVF